MASQLEIPGWANYTAMDASGDVWAYSHRPQQITDGWDIVRAPHAKADRIGNQVTFEDWRDSLIAL